MNKTHNYVIVSTTQTLAKENTNTKAQLENSNVFDAGLYQHVRDYRGQEVGEGTLDMLKQ
jgi:hypothetical protein